MFVIGIIVLLWGVILTIFCLFFYKRRIGELSNWIQVKGNVFKKKLIIASPAGSGWEVTIQYDDKNGETYYFTPKMITFPFPIGFFRVPILLYRENQEDKACLKSSYLFKSRGLFYLSFFVNTIGVLILFQT